MKRSGCPRYCVRWRIAAPRFAAALAVVVALSVYAWAGLDWGMPSTFAPEVDALVVHGGLAYEGADLSDLAADRYPPLHFLVLEGVFKVVRATVEPRADPVAVARRFLVAGRAVSLVMALVAAGAVFAIGRTTGGTATGAFAAGLFLANPMVVYYARTTNVEMPYLFWFLASLWVYHVLTPTSSRRRARWEIFFFVLAAAAVATKDQAVVLFPLLAADLVFRAPDRASRGRLAVGMVLGGLAWWVSYLPYGGHAHLDRHIESTLRISERFADHDLSPGSQIDLAGEVAIDLANTLTFPVLAAAAIGLGLVARRTKPRPAFARTVVLVAVPTLVAIQIVARRAYPRFLLPLVPIAAVAAGFALARAWNLSGRARWAGRFACLLVCVASALAGVGTIVHLERLPIPMSKAFLSRELDRGTLPSGARVGVFAVRETEAGDRGETTVLDWTGRLYDPVDPRCRIFGLPSTDDAVSRSLPDALVLFDPPESFPMPELVAGGMGYALVARFTLEKYLGVLDYAYLHQNRPRDVLVFFRDRRE